jgi:hypothetical protein
MLPKVTFQRTSRSTTKQHAFPTGSGCPGRAASGRDRSRACRRCRPSSRRRGSRGGGGNTPRSTGRPRSPFLPFPSRRILASSRSLRLPPSFPRRALRSSSPKASLTRDPDRLRFRLSRPALLPLLAPPPPTPSSSGSACAPGPRGPPSSPGAGSEASPSLEEAGDDFDSHVDDSLYAIDPAPPEDEDTAP